MFLPGALTIILSVEAAQRATGRGAGHSLTGARA
jgi:hypothetical protein